MNVPERITAILNYYNEFPNCDPNMYEFVGLCYDMVQYLNQTAPSYGIYSNNNNQYEVPRATYEKFKLLAQQVEQKLLGNGLGITPDSPLYILYKDLVNGVATYGAYPDTQLKQKLSGVALFIAQKKREVRHGQIPDFVYDNTIEFEEIQRLNEISYDPQTGGYYVNDVYVPPKPNARQLLLEEITLEYQKGAKTR